MLRILPPRDAPWMTFSSLVSGGEGDVRPRRSMEDTVRPTRNDISEEPSFGSDGGLGIE